MASMDGEVWCRNRNKYILHCSKLFRQCYISPTLNTSRIKTMRIVPSWWRKSLLSAEWVSIIDSCIWLGSGDQRAEAPAPIRLITTCYNNIDVISVRPHLPCHSQFWHAMRITMIFSPMLSSWGRLWLLITSTAHLAAITCCTVSRLSWLQPSEWRSTRTPETIIGLIRRYAYALDFEAWCWEINQIQDVTAVYFIVPLEVLVIKR